MYDFFQDFDIAMDIYGSEDSSLDKRARNVKTLIQNKTLIISNIRPNVNAVITLSEDGRIGGEYVGFMVEIVHKDNGRISCKWFGFKDCLPHTCKIGIGNANSVYKIIDHCGEKWYGSSPDDDDVRKMVKEIMEYIGAWV
jgi:hypothetical protein